MALFLPLAIAARFIALDVVSTPIAALVVREAFAIIAAYAISDFAYALLNTIYRALGFAPPVLHRDPVLSRSLRDFWGRRWNRIVGAWLDATFYRPWARRRQRAIGMSLAFAFSALVHVYVTHPALGTRWSLIVGAFFLVQGLFTLLEGPLGVARWPTLYARVWTLTIMALTAPMICEAFLRLSERWP